MKIQTVNMEVYLQIFNEFANQLTDDELTTGYYQQDISILGPLATESPCISAKNRNTIIPRKLRNGF